jgi:alpha-tubulin suppressor-like RCC1 family protein
MRRRGWERLFLLFPILCVGFACDGTGPSDENQPILTISAGFDRTCALSDDGSVYCWGSLGTVARVTNPPCVETGCFRMRPETVALGFRARELRVASNIFGDATCGISVGSQLYCWGFLVVGQDGGFLIATAPQLLSGPTISSIRVGSRHFCGLTPAGEAYCWGDYTGGVRGTGEPLATEFPEPDLLSNPVDGGIAFTELTVGAANSCGLDAAGAAYCWGSEVALGNPDASLTPMEQCGYMVPPAYGSCSHVPVPVAGGHSFSRIAAGHNHVCGVTTSEAVYCWGGNNAGQIGSGGTQRAAVPTLVPLPGPAKAISLGSGFSCALLRLGQAYCWGVSAADLAGLGGEEAAATLPAPVPGGGAYQAISAGFAHVCALRLSGEVDCWGDNTSGQLGTGNFESSAAPVQVQF